MHDVEITHDVEVTVRISRETIAKSPHLQRQIQRIKSDSNDRMRAYNGINFHSTDEVKDLRAKDVEDLGTEK